MDLTTIIGLVLGLASLITAFVIEGGSPAALLGLSAAMIVFGGTIGAVVISFPASALKNVGTLFKMAFTSYQSDPLSRIDDLVDLASVARREGILSLEERIETHPDVFLRNGARLVIDGVDPELARSIMETELTYMETRHEAGAAIFEAAGGFSPTMGIIGTVMGLIHVLSNLTDIAKLGPLIATAFIATLYGVGSANLIWLPIANKLKGRSKQEMTVLEITMEGVLSIQAGENPTILGQKLRVFLATKGREKQDSHKVAADA